MITAAIAGLTRKTAGGKGLKTHNPSEEISDQLANKTLVAT
jgi:hypothetical protein